ncbi:hypothetical protein F4778DRAFT_737521 [Xylariomycetidae sp. FL2044]|nr:hypothetical protein F4778DRAFT_737521 [Xylariomycetidae sp. FL2044]
MSLASLPNELILEIVENLRIEGRIPNSWDCDMRAKYGTLASLCRVSRRFAILTRPELYRTIDNSIYNQTPLFFRTLVGNPHLGSLVRHMDMTSFIEYEEPETWEGLETVLGSFDEPLAEYLHYNNFTFLHTRAAVLALLPNLQSLTIDLFLQFEEAAWSIIDLFFGYIDQDTGDRQESRLPYMKSLNLYRGGFDKLEIVASMAECASVLPNLTTLRGRSIDWDLIPGDLTGDLALETVYLETTHCHPEGLDDMFSRCPQLKDLELSPEMGVDRAGIGAVLREHGQGLEKLKLNIKPIRWIDEALGSLCSLSSLQFLEISYGCIENFPLRWNWDSLEWKSTLDFEKFLPPSIQVVSLRSDDSLRSDYSPYQDWYRKVWNVRWYALATRNKMNNLRKIEFPQHGPVPNIWVLILGVHGWKVEQPPGPGCRVTLTRH